MKLDVYADLEHLFMLNFPVRAGALESLVPAPLRLHTVDGRAFPSIVLPRIGRLRSTAVGWPRVGYALYGLRILVEYASERLGPTKGICFAQLLMDPAFARAFGNLLTDFDFRPGTVEKRERAPGWWDIEVRDGDDAEAVKARVRPADGFPEALPTDPRSTRTPTTRSGHSRTSRPRRPGLPRSTAPERGRAAGSCGSRAFTWGFCPAGGAGFPQSGRNVRGGGEQRSLRALRAVLLFIALFHLVTGAGLAFSEDFQRRAVALYGARVEWGPGHRLLHRSAISRLRRDGVASM